VNTPAKTSIVEFLMGTLILGVAAIFFYYAYTTSTGAHRSGYTLTAQFDRIDGLNPGNDVKLSGVTVGLVKKIEIDPTTYMARVHLKIDPAVKLPSDSSAEIISESFMGGKYIALVPGGGDTFLNEGQVISFTQAAVSWESLIGKFLFSKTDEAQGKK
jgi:phospholipid/cholesterol/gamma-HCH transport system substrate-binding protein